MTEPTVIHATTVLERSFEAPVERVFEAIADPAAHGRWNVPEEGWEIAEEENDFRTGGRNYIRFGPPGESIYHSEGHFETIVPNSLSISSGTMHTNSKPDSCTLCTIELIPDGEGTRLILTDQSAFFGGEKPEDREEGWKSILDKLEVALRNAPIWLG